MLLRIEDFAKYYHHISVFLNLQTTLAVQNYSHEVNFGTSQSGKSFPYGLLSTSLKYADILFSERSVTFTVVKTSIKEARHIRRIDLHIVRGKPKQRLYLGAGKLVQAVSFTLGKPSRKLLRHL